MPNCYAFTKNATPCTAFGHTDGLCGRHLRMVATPEKQVQFTRDQTRLRARWINQQGVVPVPVAAAPVAAVLVPLCGHIMRSGRPCEHEAQFTDGKCRLHHVMILRHAENDAYRTAMQSVRTLFARNETDTVIDARVAELSLGLSERVSRQLADGVDRMILSNYLAISRRLIMNEGANADTMNEVIAGWIGLGLAPRRADVLARHAEDIIQMHNARGGRVARQIPANQREAQLAADSQNVHTAEITKQMKDSLEILLAVEVPTTQKETLREMVDSWRRIGKTEAEITVVHRDVLLWWNKHTVYSHEDKMYRRAIRGLWWTIKNYKGEVREELEKRMWDECRDACIPYSVCTQGHIARLTNVMVGFDDAFVPPVEVGEILQQKMGAISEMDVDDAKKIELAKAVLEELKVPLEKHNDWLAAF